MSYQVIARKWRPKDFDQLVGQSHVSQTLLNAIRNDRLHHALLFTGQRGTGKTSTARILAKALRCPEDQNGESQEAQEIATGRSINVIEIDGASNNGVDAIRELRETVGYMPSTGRYKVYIIDEVHMLSTAAFNALLKTLEEPPEHVVFILATTEVQKIPNTILSRCQRFDFRRIPVALIAKHLQQICEADGVSATQEALWAIARQGEGSMRDCLSLLDQVITFSENDIDLAKVSEILGLTDRTLLLEVLRGLIQRDSQNLLNIIEKIFTAGYDPKVFSQDLLEEIRNLLIVKSTPTNVSSLLDIPESEAEALGQLGKELSEEDIHMLFDMALKGVSDLNRSQEPRIVLEMLILRMAAAPRIQSLLGLNSTAAPAEKKTLIPPPTQAQVSKTPEIKKDTPKDSTLNKPTASGKTQPSQDLIFGYNPELPAQKNWHNLVARIKKVNGLIGAQLENIYLARLEEKTLYLGVPQSIKFMYEKINNPDFRKKVLNYVSTYWGPGFQMDVQVDEGKEDRLESLTPKQALEKEEALQEGEVRKLVEDHPMMKSAQSLFKTEIKSIKETKS